MDFDHIPPHDESAERACLGAALADDAARSEVLTALTSSDFYLEKHTVIFEAIRELADAGTPADPVTVEAGLRRNGEIEAVGGSAYLTELLAGTPTTANARHYCGLVRNAAQKRRMIVLALNLYRGALDGREETELLKEARAGLDRIGTGKGGPESLLIPAAEIEPLEVDWLWPGFIPEGVVTIIAGKAGASKSHLSLLLAALVSQRKPMPGASQATPGGRFNVLLIPGEDDPERVIVPRLISYKADRARVIIHRGLPRPGGEPRPFVLDPGFITRLEIDFQRVRPRLAVLDPLGALLPAKLDLHRQNEVHVVIAALSRLAGKYNSAILLIHHTKKSSDGAPLNSLLGSVALGAGARAVHLIAEDVETGDRHLLPVKSNLGALPRGLRFAWQGNHLEYAGPSDMKAEDAITPEAPDERAGRAVAEEFLFETLRDGPKPSSEVRSDAGREGIAPRTLDRARRSLNVKSRKTVAGWEISLP